MPADRSVSILLLSSQLLHTQKYTKNILIYYNINTPLQTLWFVFDLYFCLRLLHIYLYSLISFFHIPVCMCPSLYMFLVVFNSTPILLPRDADLPFPLPASVSKAHPDTRTPLLCIPLGQLFRQPTAEAIRLAQCAYQRHDHITGAIVCYYVWQTLNAAKRPLIVIGSSTLQRPDGAALHRTVSALAQAVREKSGCDEDWRVLNILQRVCTLQWDTLLLLTNLCVPYILHENL